MEKCKINITTFQNSVYVMKKGATTQRTVIEHFVVRQQNLCHYRPLATQDGHHVSRVQFVHLEISNKIFDSQWVGDVD